MVEGRSGRGMTKNTAVSLEETDKSYRPCAAPMGANDLGRAGKLIGTSGWHATQHAKREEMGER